MNSFLNIQVRIIAQQAQAMLRQLNTQMNSLGSGGFSTGRLDRMGSQMQWLGRQIEYNFTMPLALAGVAATKLALDNEAAFTRIAKVYGDATHGAQFYAKELESLKKAFVALSNQFGISQADTLNIAADWAAAGASGLALAKSVELTMRTMVLGEMNAGQATNSLIAIQAQYGLSISQLSDTVDILNMVENQTGTKLIDLVEGFTRAAGVARAAGVDVRHLAADIAALTPATGTAANAGNALKTIFSRLFDTTKQATEVLGLMGINTMSFAWQSANAQDKLIAMAKSFETLSDANKNYVSSIIASRYQVNRFDQLMKELVSDHGYYARALQSTTDMNAVYKQSTQELNMVLQSSPQRLKVMWTMIQNSVADIIQPLIPVILWFATAVMKLVQAFANLDPGIQKFILFTLVLLAAIGPVVRYFGAVQVLVFELAKIFRLLLLPVELVGFLFRYLVAIPVQLFFEAASIAARSMVLAFAWAAQAIPFLLRGMTIVSEAIIVGFTRVIAFMATAGAAALINGTSFILEVVTGLWALMMGGIQKIVAAGMLGINTIYAVGLAGVQRILLAFATFSGVAWRAITTAPLVLLRSFWAAIVAGFTGLLPWLGRMGLLMLDALTGPIGIAVTAAVLLIILFWDQIKKVWQNGVNFFRGGAGLGDAFTPLGRAAMAVRDVVMRAFNALPAGIRSAMIAVVDTIASAAKAVYQWFSYLNPFAKHSPSLVDNVKGGSEAIQGHFATTNSHADNHRQVMAATTAAGAAGANEQAGATQGAMDTVRAQYQSLLAVGTVFNKAGDDLQKFASKVASVQQELDRIQYAKIRKDLAAIAGDAVPEFDRLVNDLYPLEQQLKKVSGEMGTQKGIVEDWKNKLDDATATLKIQQDALDAMKVGVDTFTAKLQVLSGGIELLSGMRTQLRQAGAGSDILKSYDDQIKALDDQKTGINDQLKAAQSAYLTQEMLVKRLTDARDKLQESYDLENRKLEVIKDAYDQINQRIQAIKQSINDFSGVVSQLNSAKGKTDATAANFAAGAGANFPDVGGQGQIGREGGIGDQSAEIDKFTKALGDKTKDLFGKFDFMAPIKKAWNKAWDWVKTTFGPIGGWIGDFFGNLFKDVHMPKMELGGFTSTFKDIFSSIGDAFKSIWNLIGPPLKEIGKVIEKNFGEALKAIWPQIKQFKELLGPLGDAFKMAWENVKPLAAIIGGILLLAINIVAGILQHTLGPVIRIIVTIIKSLIQILRGLIEFLIGVFTGNWGLAWKGVTDVFIGTINLIWGFIYNWGMALWGIVWGIVQGVVNFFVWLYDELVGHSIIPDLVNAIKAWFEKMHEIMVAIWNALVAALKWIWENILWPVFRAIGDVFKGVGDIVAAVVGWIRQKWDDFVNGLRIMWGWVQQIIQWVKDKFWEIVGAVANTVNTVHGWIDSFVNKIISIKDRIGNTLSRIWDGLKDGFRDAINWVIDRWNGLSFDAGPVHISVPQIPHLARGGTVASEAMAIVGEGRKGYPEYVIPTDPQYRDRAMALYSGLGRALGIDHLFSSTDIIQLFSRQVARGVSGERIQLLASGGLIGRASVRSGSQDGATVVVASSPDGKKEYHFHGDLSFPNVKSGSDAKEFVRNLQALAGS